MEFICDGSARTHLSKKAMTMSNGNLFRGGSISLYVFFTVPHKIWPWFWLGPLSVIVIYTFKIRRYDEIYKEQMRSQSRFIYALSMAELAFSGRNRKALRMGRGKVVAFPDLYFEHDLYLWPHAKVSAKFLVLTMHFLLCLFCILIFWKWKHFSV